MSNTSQKDQDPVRRMLAALAEDQNVNEALDNQMLEYVRAELDGQRVNDLYPAVHEYIRSSEHALILYSSLLEWERAERAGVVHAASQTYQPDISFVGTSQNRQPLSDVQARVVEIAERVASTLSTRLSLRIADFVDTFFSLRPRLPDAIKLDESLAGAFGAADAEIPEELSWLEATYQFQQERISNPSGDARSQAHSAAQNAGLPQAFHARFAELAMKWVA